MNRKSKVIVSIVGITIVLLALLGITYAYYLTRIEGNTNTNSISVTTADLKLVYKDGNGHVTKENIMPGTTIEKTFTVENTGNNKVDNYAVYLEEVINTLSRTEDLTYELTCESTVDDCYGSSGKFPQLAGNIAVNSIDTGVTHFYTLVVTYKNEENIDQSIDMGSNISAFVQIYAMKDILDIEGEVENYDDGDYAQINSIQKRSQIVDGKYRFAGVLPGTHTLKVCGKSDLNCINPKFSQQIIVNVGTEEKIEDNKITMIDRSHSVNVDINVSNGNITIGTQLKEYNPFKEGTLSYTIYRNAQNITEEQKSKLYAEFSKPKTTVAESLSSIDESVLASAPEGDGITYYFRGNVKNNYLNFAGMCWRIVRTEKDGSVRLILDDDAAVCNDNEGIDRYTGTWNVCNGKAASEQWDSNDEDWTACNYGLGQILNRYCGSSNDNGCGSNIETGDTMVKFKTLENSLFMIGGVGGTKYSVDGEKLKSTKLCYGNKNKFYDEYNDELSKDTILDLITNYYESSEGAFYYSNAFRYGKGEKLSATFTCDENGMSEETYKIFPITADEIIFAGGKMDAINKNFYFYNGKEYYADFNGGFFTQSIVYYDGFFEKAVYFSNGRLSTIAVDTPILARPAISLKAEVEYKSGDGSIESPYEIK